MGQDRMLTLYSVDTRFDASATEAFENTVGKGEIACNKQFLLFPQCFLPNQIIVPPFVHIFGIISLFGAEFEKPKNGKSGKGLIEYLTHYHPIQYNSIVNPLPDNKILDWSKLKQIADDILKYI